MIRGCPLKSVGPMKTQPVSLILAVILSFVLNAAAATLYVDLNSTNPVPPYGDWSTAATNIQDAVDAAAAGEEILVTNGIYAAKGLAINGISNRVAVTKPLVVQSVSGPEATVIQGYFAWDSSAVRCVYLTNGASLTGFTLTGGAALSGAGGVQGESTNALISNCVIFSNSFVGAYGATLENCTLLNTGCGAEQCVLNQCLVISNSSGGASYCYPERLCCDRKRSRLGRRRRQLHRERQHLVIQHCQPGRRGGGLRPQPEHPDRKRQLQ